jgi:hypothetical protein
MTDQEILHVYVEIASGRGRWGGRKLLPDPFDGFLLAFAEAVVRADSSTFMLMRPVALLLMSKYGLEKYLENFNMTHEAQS